MSKMNPLSQYTKIEEIFTKLVTNDVIKYPEGVLHKGVKCGVCARSARDEIMLNSPDALISGDAISRIIENCVPNVEDADELYVNDVEQLLIAIKVATKEETYDINVECPECDHKGRFERNLSYLLDTAQPFTEQPVVHLDNGLAVYFRPFVWREFSDFSTRMFTEHQRTRYIETSEELTEEEKIEIFKDVFEKMTQLNYDMISCTVQKIVTPDDVEVTEMEFIQEWLSSQPKGVLKVIREKMDEVLDVGISHEMEVSCSNCNHEWTIDGLKYDPAHFFASSFSTQDQTKSDN